MLAENFIKDVYYSHMDYNQQQQMMSYGKRAGESILVVVVRLATDVLKFLWKFVVEMAKSVVGK
jgi:hypothetical protein